MSSEETVVEGQIIAGRYRVVEKLGAGATAIIYKVKEQSLGTYLALKLLRAEKMKEDQLVRFHREARALSSLHHANLVSILDFGLSEDNIPYLVMDYVEGSTLRQYLKSKGPLEFEPAVKALLSICDVIGYIHKQKVLHRDLKSSNFMVATGPGFQLKLLDFGLAKALTEEDGVDLTQVGLSVGTPTYMSPEQVRGEAADERADIYALGCLLHELFTGAVPFKGATSMDTMKMHLEAEPPSIELPDSDLDTERLAALQKVFDRCLAKAREDRFASVNELKESLEALLPGALAPVHEPENEPVDSPEPAAGTSASKSAGAFGAGAVGFTILGLLLLGLFVFFVLRVTSEDFIATEKIAGKIARIADSPGTLSRDMLGKYPSFRGECKIIWHMMGEMSDEDVFAFTADSVPSYMSFNQMKKVSTKGLEHAATIPFLGLGLNFRDLTGEQLRLFAREDSPLEVLYIRANPGLRDEDLASLKALKHLKLLVIGDNNFTDESLKYVSEVHSITTLKLNGLPELTGSGIKYLKALPNLRRLCLNRDSISEDGFKYLTELKGLDLLTLQQAQLNEARLQHLTKLPLRKLDLSGSNVKDKDLAILAKIPSLKVLRLYACPNINAQRILEFKKRRPDCAVDVYFRELKLDGDPLLWEEGLSI